MNSKVSLLSLSLSTAVVVSKYYDYPSGWLFYIERAIDGTVFCSLSREDIAIIFPKDNQFILVVRLYKFVQKSRFQDEYGLESENHSTSLTDVASLSSKTSSTPATTSSFSVSSHVKKSSNKSTGPSNVLATNRKRVSDKCHEFTWPKFSPDLEQAIKADQFVTPAKSNKFIHEACRAYKGYCQSIDKEVTTEDKKKLSTMLCELAPKSLGDPDCLAVAGVPEVMTITCLYL